jgi:N-acetylglutamate synthase-like GNAT family acetyltransferase
MHVRKIRPGEAAPAVELARKLGLDYPGLESDPLWIAEKDGQAIGLVALKKHPDCLELCALGVDPVFRGKGVAKALVEALMDEATGDVHLATVIPRFFESCGFHIIKEAIPLAFPAKRQTAWCEGCPQQRCTVMLRKNP